MGNHSIKWETMKTFSIQFLLPCLVLIPTTTASYSMYVWQNGWDSTVAGCTGNPTEFLAWQEKTSPCFTDTWSTVDKRDWLWSTCNVAGREVGTIYLYGMNVALATQDCNYPGVQLIQQTLTEGHSAVPGIQIYALYSDGGDNVPESAHVPNVVWYNQNCATGASDRIDGVAVNNENWNKSWKVKKMTTYLDNLNKIRTFANQQLPAGSLKIHFSVGYSWGKDKNSNDIVIDWNGKSQPVMRHFIDVFDSLDVQVAYILPEQMQSRFQMAESTYAASLQNKTMFLNTYISETLPCQTTFFPFPPNTDECPLWSYDYKTETQMFVQLDAFQNLVGAPVALHYFRGAYSSGGDPNWPRH